MLIIRGVNVFPSQIEEQVLAIPQLAAHYQLELYREGPLEAIDVHVELHATAAAADAESAAAALRRAVKAYVGITAGVNVHPAGSLPRSQGKAVRITRR
jgi:phenylacetate-CoA ligase